MTEQQTDSRQSLLFVIGMHRTGTSALCAALDACGAQFGQHLLAAMAGVNDEGFWEDGDFVAINEQLLEIAGCQWYTVIPSCADIDWMSAEFKAVKASAEHWLRSRLAPGSSISAVKDPRLCVTMPFWSAVCEQCSVDVQMIFVDRAPLEVAQSLRKRDLFPLSYGLRLYLAYHECVESFVEGQIDWIAFQDLLDNTTDALATQLERLPLLTLPEKGFEEVRGALKHYYSDGASDALSLSRKHGPGLQELERTIEERFPLAALPGELAQVVAARGCELAEVGEQHTLALATLDQKDRDISALSSEHRLALTTITERDAQLVVANKELERTGEHLSEALATIATRDEDVASLDARLQQLGNEHSHALTVVNERDAQIKDYQQRLEKIAAMPVLGRVFMKIWNNAGR